jgi:tripartite-type tricarboxylate transporter receptor subunit TctC
MFCAKRLMFAVVCWLPSALGSWPAPAAAQAWPQRTVRFILPLGPGSGSDIGARLLADRLSKRWGQPVVVENRPGGDGILAVSSFVAARDDHILLFSPTSSFAAHIYLHENLPYKAEDLLPIARVSNTLISVAVPIASPVNSLTELIAAAKAEPGKLNWAGVTGAHDFGFAGFLKTVGAEMTKVPYRNTVEAANDLAQGRVQVFQAAVAIVQPQLLLGKIKLIAISNSVRSPTAPDLPTAAEQGYPSLQIDGLIGIFGPRDMPLELRKRIAADVQEVMSSDPVITDRLMQSGQLPNPGGPEEFAAANEEQRTRLAQVASYLGIKPKR